MRKAKVCLLGAFAVGKTSLVSRFVTSLFSERYHTTIGVKIDRKTVSTPSGALTLLLWDLAGEDAFNRVEPDYLRGASGYLLVVDGTRRRTLDEAIALEERGRKALGPVPLLLLINKSDLRSEWEVERRDFEMVEGRGWQWLCTSAKTGEGVEAAFMMLADHIISGRA